MANGPTLSQQQVQQFFTAQGMPNITGSGGDAAAALNANPALAAAFGQFQVDQQAITDPTTVGNIQQTYQQSLQPQTVQDYMSGNIQNPNIPIAAYQVYRPQEVQQNELMTGEGTQISPTTVSPPTDIVAPQLGEAQQAEAFTVDEQGVLQQFNPNTGQYEAVTTGGQAEQAVAQQGQVSEQATVQGQLKELYEDIDQGIPDWARGAVTNANEVMAARGLANSSIGGMAISAAIQQSALPIAAQDASTYFQMDMQNLANRQQTELFNVQTRQQALLTDTAAQNAAAQFNAQSESQTQQFMTSLVAQIKEQNAARKTAISQVNAKFGNDFIQAQAALDDGVNKFNSQMRNQVEAFNAQMELQRKTFNATNAFAIEQSNVLWRRAVNTGNTAGYNATNQANAMNAFNLSSAALNALWQQHRDNDAWLNTAAESQRDRDFYLDYLANQQGFAEDQGDISTGQLVGSFATYATTEAGQATIRSAINSVFGGDEDETTATSEEEA